MRPKSIQLFEKLFLSNMIVSIAAIFLNYGALRADAIARGKAAAGPLLGIIFTLLIDLTFWFFVARRASRVAKWLLVLFYGLGFFGMVPMIPRIIGFGPSYIALTVLASALSIAAMTMLFRRDAHDWLARKGAPSLTDPSIFE